MSDLQQLADYRSDLELTYADRLTIFGEHDAGTLKQVKSCLDNGAENFVLCADGHLGYGHPIGGVASYRDKISLNGVGFDIACGTMLVTTDADSDDVHKNISTIMDDIFANISFGIGRSNAIKVDHPLFEDSLWKQCDFLRPLKQLAVSQIGTIGSGNHYVDIFIDDLGRVCVGVHFGSRGLGHKIATHFLKLAGAKDGMHVPPAIVDASSPTGADYLVGMDIAGQYAYAGREWVCDYIVKNILKAEVLDIVHNHHNYAWKEEHYGEFFWVVRKGVTPAFPGQRGFVGGSMGDNAFVVEGVDTPKAGRALYSTVHGAGRIMSRMAARGKKGKPGLISRDAMNDWIKAKGVELRGADTDEAPQAYRRLHEVLDCHHDTVKLVRELRPIGIAMAGKDVVDPYKD